MTIEQIKQHLTLSMVLQHYGLKPDKNLRLHCPFHPDKTPSLQVYYKTHTCYCFSSNCKTHGKSIDVIDFILYKENCSKREAIAKAKSLLGGTIEKHPDTHTRESFLQNIFLYFKNAVHNSPPAQSYLEKRFLNHRQIEIGYNGGQFHHGQRKSQELISQSLEYGLLSDRGMKSKTGDPSYLVFGKTGIVFPLKNAEGQIVSMYFRSIISDTGSKHFYLKDRQGLYPAYPEADTQTLIVTEAIIDAATLLMHQQTLNLPSLSVLACYGTNGLTEEHLKAIQSLEKLQEIIFFFDGDLAGQKALTPHCTLLKELHPHLQITSVITPEGEDVNSLLQGHDHAIYRQLIKSRKPIDPTKEFSFTEMENLKAERTSPKEVPAPEPVTVEESLLSGLAHNLTYQGKEARYSAKGLLKNPQDSLKVALQIRHPQSSDDYRSKVDLYEYKQLQQAAKSASESLQLNQLSIEHDLMDFTRLLEHYKEIHTEGKAQKSPVTIPPATVTACIRFLKEPRLLELLNEKIGQSGIVGEANSRLFLFLIALSYKMPFTLHALIQGSSGSGKTRLMQTISRLMPPEDTKHFTRVTESSFYNYGEYDLQNKLLCFEDIDGLKEEALLALRELQSNDILISSTSIKDESGKIQSGERIVRGPIASLSATTQGSFYEDNISRSFVIAVDESPEQTRRIIDYQNQRAAGEINSTQQHRLREFIQNCVRLLSPREVVNPYAHKIQLPRQTHKIRRLNEMYQSIIKQMVILHQYQRHEDKQGRLVAQKEDLQHACEILFESIILKVDELEGDLRQFYEQLKQYVQSRSAEENKPVEDIRFNRFEIRAATQTSKTQQHRYIQQLLELEYLHQYGFANRGYTYRINLWDNMSQLRQDIKSRLSLQMQDIVAEKTS